MKIELVIPDELPHGHGSSFKKGIVDALLKSAKTKLAHTPKEQEKSRKLGQTTGEELVKHAARIVKP